MRCDRVFGRMANILLHLLTQIIIISLIFETVNVNIKVVGVLFSHLIFIACVMTKTTSFRDYTISRLVQYMYSWKTQMAC